MSKTSPQRGENRSGFKHTGVCMNCGRKTSYRKQPRSRALTCGQCGHTVRIKSRRMSAVPHPVRVDDTHPEGAATAGVDWRQRMVREQLRTKWILTISGLCGAGVVAVMCWIMVMSIHKSIVENRNNSPEGKKRAIEEIASADSSAIPLLIVAVGGESSEAQHAAVTAFQRLGPSGKEAVPDLRRLLASDGKNVQRTSLRCLTAIGSEAAAAKPDVISLLDTASADTQAGAIKALQLWVAPSDLAPHLLPLINSGTLSLQAAAIEGLVGSGVAGRDAIPELVTILRRDSGAPAAAAARALGSIAPEDEDVFRALQLALNRPSQNIIVETAVIEGLGHMGARAIPLLEAAIERPGRIVAAAEALASTQDKSAVPILIKALNGLEAIEKSERAAAFHNRPQQSRVTRSTTNALGETLATRTYQIGSDKATQNYLDRAFDRVAANAERRRFAITKALDSLGVRN